MFNDGIRGHNLVVLRSGLAALHYRLATATRSIMFAERGISPNHSAPHHYFGHQLQPLTKLQCILRSESYAQWDTSLSTR